MHQEFQSPFYRTVPYRTVPTVPYRTVQQPLSVNTPHTSHILFIKFNGKKKNFEQKLPNRMKYTFHEQHTFPTSAADCKAITGTQCYMYLSNIAAYWNSALVITQHNHLAIQKTEGGVQNTLKSYSFYLSICVHSDKLSVSTWKKLKFVTVFFWNVMQQFGTLCSCLKFHIIKSSKINR
jgi:hypothetical protein